MDSIGILHQPKMSESLPLAVEIKSWLAARGVSAWTTSSWNPAEIEACLPDTSLLIVLGGDGSLLRAARLAAPMDVPLFGVNMGRVGFLTEADPDDWQDKLDQVLRGQCWWERRLMLHAELQRDSQVLDRLVALNDVVIGRGTQARVIRLGLFVDGEHITTYTADGVIAATPTGSTAYSLAAGGPLLPPQLQNFLVIPVAPHLSFDRALVLHQEAIVTVQVKTSQEVMVTADGQDVTSLQIEDKIVINKHKHESCFVRLGKSSYFYHRLMERLGLGILGR